MLYTWFYLKVHFFILLIKVITHKNKYLLTNKNCDADKFYYSILLHKFRQFNVQHKSNNILSGENIENRAFTLNDCQKYVGGIMLKIYFLF